MLQLILPGEIGNETKYRKDAANTDRIDTALSKKYCSSQTSCALCYQKLSADVAHDLVQLWCKLGDEAQTHFLASMYEATISVETEREDLQHRTDDYIEEKNGVQTGFMRYPRHVIEDPHETPDTHSRYAQGFAL